MKLHILFWPLVGHHRAVRIKMQMQYYNFHFHFPVWELVSHVTIIKYVKFTLSYILFPRFAQIPGARSPWRINSVRWRLISVGPQYGTWFKLSFWAPEFAARFLENLCTPVMANKNVKINCVVDRWMKYEYGELVEWHWEGQTEVLGDKPVPVLLCPPQRKSPREVEESRWDSQLTWRRSLLVPSGSFGSVSDWGLFVVFLSLSKPVIFFVLTALVKL
jgi:hypothetical protein